VNREFSREGYSCAREGFPCPCPGKFVLWWTCWRHGHEQLAQQLFDLWIHQKIWKICISSASERAFPGDLGDFFGCYTLSKKICFSTQEFTNFLSTAPSQRRATRIQTSLVIVIFMLRVLTYVVSYWLFWNWIVVVQFAAVCVPLRSYGKGTGIVIRITQTKLREREGSRESSCEKIWESRASWRRCLRGFWTKFLGVLISQKSEFLVDKQFKDLDPSPIFWSCESFHSLPKKCSWW